MIGRGGSYLHTKPGDPLSQTTDCKVGATMKNSHKNRSQSKHGISSKYMYTKQTVTGYT